MPKRKPRLFLDADGVLADFDLAARQLLGVSPKEYIETRGRGAFWARLAKARNFYGSLPEIQAEALINVSRSDGQPRAALETAKLSSSI